MQPYSNDWISTVCLMSRNHLIANDEADVNLTELMAQAGEAIVHLDSQWVVRYCNEPYLASIGLPRDEVMNRTPFDYSPNFRRSIFFELIEKCFQTGKPVSRIGFSTLLDRWLMVRLFPVGKGLVMLANDASESVVKQYHLAQQVVKDPLTGLGNKVGLIEELETRVVGGARFGLTIIALNRFRDINIVHGYSAGDMALLEIASRLQTATLQDEILFRVSGDEFGVLATGAESDLQERASAFVRAVEAPFTLNEQRFVLSASAGVAEYPVHGAGAEEILKLAGLAVNEAKRPGAEVVQRYRRELEAASRKRAEIENELRSAIAQEQFTLYLQPKSRLSNGAVVGAEALIRWAHPKHGLISPLEFLPAAQGIGMMRALDQWVLRHALMQVDALKVRGLRMPVSINLSVDSLADVGFVAMVREALLEAHVEPELLEVEIPEGALMHDVKSSVKVLEALNEMGVKISIDDFGTGYSSFSYLARFPVHALKIDRSFVSAMTTSDANRTIVKTMVRLGHALSMEVVAEGAETPEQISALKRMRCDVVQGYGIARPMPFNGFCEFSRTMLKSGSVAPNALSI